MADNVGVTEGTDKNIATDDIDGVHYQRVKQCFGSDGFATDVSPENPFPIRAQPIGLGGLQSVPNATTNGTAIGELPAKAIGVRLYLSPGDALTFGVEPVAPSAAPSNTYSLSYSVTGPNWDENLAGGQMLYITSKTGNPKFRWI